MRRVIDPRRITGLLVVVLGGLLSACATNTVGYSGVYDAAAGEDAIMDEALEAAIDEAEAEGGAANAGDDTAPQPPASTVSVDGQSFVYVTVTSNRATAYHWILDTRWRALGQTDAQRQAAVLNSLVFGPEGIGDRVPLRREARYRFIPVCDGRPRWDLAQRRGFPVPATLELRCE